MVQVLHKIQLSSFFFKLFNRENNAETDFSGHEIYITLGVRKPVCWR